MRPAITKAFLLLGSAALGRVVFAPCAPAQTAQQPAPYEPSHYSVQQRQPFGAENTVTIHIRLLNGKTGQPIAGKEIFLERSRNQLLSHAEDHDIKTDTSGLAEAVVAKDGVVLNPVVIDYRSCTPRIRHTGESEKSERFSVADILATGVVAKNTCGKQISASVPGELVLYFRTRHLFERITE